LDAKLVIWANLRAHMHTFTKLPNFPYSLDILVTAGYTVEGLLKGVSDMRKKAGIEKEFVYPIIPAKYKKPMYRF
jgi:hypothetical protein